MDINAERLWDALRANHVTFEKLDGVTLLKLPEGVHWLTEASSTLVVRQCNREMYEMIRGRIQGKPQRGVVITGNPGPSTLSLSFLLIPRNWEKLVLELLPHEVGE